LRVQWSVFKNTGSGATATLSGADTLPTWSSCVWLQPILHYYAVHGVCYNLNAHKHGWHWKLTSIDIKSLILKHHTIYLVKIQA
jgi:hypothetical protein